MPTGLEPGPYDDDGEDALAAETTVARDGGAALRGEKAGFTADPIDTAEEFHRRVQLDELQRSHVVALEGMRREADLRSQRIWAPVIAVVILGALALIAFMVHQVTEQNTERHRIDHAHQVTVWCYADPNSDRGTSTITGSPDDVKGFCPDASGR